MGKGLSATQRTLRELKAQGLICGSVEKFNPYVGEHGIRQDLFGFIDIIALDTSRGIIAIQSCGQAFSAHRHKLLEERNEAVFEWLRCGGKLQLYGWRKVKLHRGGKAMRWRPRIADIYLDAANEELEFVERK